MQNKQDLNFSKSGVPALGSLEVVVLLLFGTARIAT